MSSSEAYQELLEEILNNIEESLEEKDWDTNATLSWKPH